MRIKMNTKSIILIKKEFKMKYFIHSIVMVLIMALSLDAQIRMGVVGGVNFANLETTGESEVSTRTVFGIGAVFDLGLSENFILCLEPMYIQKGGRVEEGEDINSDPGGWVKSSFIEIPLFLKVTYGSRIRPYLMAGPTIGYLLNSDLEIDAFGLSFEGDMKDVTKRIDFGLGFGAGITIPIRFFSLFIEGRYTLGLNNLQRGGTFEVSAGPLAVPIDFDEEDDKYKNRGFQILAGIAFSLGRKN